MTTALEGNLQAAKDDFEVMLLETSASNKKIEAQARAEAHCAKASSGADNAEAALKSAR